MTALKPSFATAGGGSEQLQTELDLLSPRYLFTAFRRVDCRFDNLGFAYIEPGQITMLGVHRYQARNLKRIESPDSDEPEFIWESRKPGLVLRVLREREKDIVVLEELTGLDPANEQHNKLLYDLQSALLPHSFTSGHEQLAWLQSREQVAESKGEIYSKTLARMIAATEMALLTLSDEVQELKDNLAQRAAGHKGYHNRAWSEDRRACEWIGEEVPSISNPLQKKDGFDAAAFAQAIAAANAETLKQMMAMMMQEAVTKQAEPEPASPVRVTDDEVNGKAKPTRPRKPDANFEQ